jgi:UDP-glucose 4-epimerase
VNDLVVGHGLLGHALAVRWGAPVVDRHPVIEWARPETARSQLADLAHRFGQSVRGAWRVAWCAGSGVVGTSSAHFAIEESYLQSFLHALREALPNRAWDQGAIFFASSAGGVYGAGAMEVITEQSEPSPVSAYGHAKVAQESIVTSWAADTSVRCYVGRLSNLYGSRQNLSKPQGFVSQLLRSILLRSPFTLRVNGDTQRDFLFADDAAAKIDRWMQDPSMAGVKIVADGQSHTMIHVAQIVHGITRIPPKVVYAAASESAVQPRALRFRSSFHPVVDRDVPGRALDIGIAQTWNTMLWAFAKGGFR